MEKNLKKVQETVSPILVLVYNILYRALMQTAQTNHQFALIF